MFFLITLAIATGIDLSETSILVSHNNATRPQVYGERRQDSTIPMGVSTESTSPGEPGQNPGTFRRPSSVLRSINGDTVYDIDYPFVVGLHDAYHYNFCGGSILTPRLVLTAAHCISRRLSHVIITRRDRQSKTSYRVNRKIQYPRYDEFYELHDLGLLLLKGRIENAPAIELIPKSWKVRIGATASAFGWGVTEQGTLSRVLRKVDLPVIDTDRCAKAFGFRAHWICTDSHRRDICNGDSGGPLVVDGCQVGIVSIGNEECQSGVPSAFTAVAAYRSWIDWYTARYY